MALGSFFVGSIVSHLFSHQNHDRYEATQANSQVVNHIQESIRYRENQFYLVWTYKTCTT